MTCSTRSKRSKYGMDRSILTKAWKIKCSLTVNVPMNKSSCCTYADLEIIELELTLRPLIATVPEVTIFFPDLSVNAFKSVVFPAPEEPIITKSSPGWARPNAKKSVYELSYWTFRWYLHTIFDDVLLLHRSFPSGKYLPPIIFSFYQSVHIHIAPRECDVLTGFMNCVVHRWLWYWFQLKNGRVLKVET